MILTKLIFNKTIVFNTPIECDNVPLVRTGGIESNENEPLFSLINCLLHANIKKYGSMKDEERKTKIQKIKQDVYEKIKNGDVKKNIESFLNNFKENLTNFNIYLNSNHYYATEFASEVNKSLNEKLLRNGNIEQINLYKLLYEIVTIDSFKKILKNTELKWGDECCILSFKKIFLKEMLRFLSYQDFFDDLEKSKTDFITKTLILMVNTIVDISFSNVKIAGKDNFITNDLDVTKINILSEYFDCNIIFVDSEDRIPFLIGNQHDVSDKKKYTVVFSFEQKHFEIIGKLLQDDRIQRNFMPYEEIVKKIKFYLKRIDKDEPVEEPKVIEKDEPVSEPKAIKKEKEPVSEPKAIEKEKEPVEESKVIEKEKEPVVEKPKVIEKEKEPVVEEPKVIEKEKEPVVEEPVKEESKKNNINENINYNNSDDELMSVLGDD